MLPQLEKPAHFLSLPLSLTTDVSLSGLRRKIETVCVQTPLQTPVPSVCHSSAKPYGGGATGHQMPGSLCFPGFSAQLGIWGPGLLDRSAPFRLACPAVLPGRYGHCSWVSLLAHGSPGMRSLTPCSSCILLSQGATQLSAGTVPLLSPQWKTVSQPLHLLPSFVCSLVLLEHLLWQFSKKGCMGKKFLSFCVFFCCHNR